MLIDEGGLSIDSDLDGQGTAPNSGSELLFGAWLGESEEERGMDRYRTGGVAAINHLERWQPARRQPEGNLIGEPIDTQRGESGEESAKASVTRKSATVRTSNESTSSQREADAEQANTTEPTVGDEGNPMGNGEMLVARPPQPFGGGEGVLQPHVSSTARTTWCPDGEREEGEADSPQPRMSISLSVSEVETSVLEELQVAEMTTKARDHFSAQVETRKAGHRQVETKAQANVKEEKKLPRKSRIGTGVEEASSPSTFFYRSEKRRGEDRSCATL